MKHRYAALTFVTLLVGAQSALAANFSFTGNFTQDDTVQFFNFSITSPGTVTLQTLSFDGGVNAAGDTIAAGGFVPFLHLWDSLGNDLGGAEVSTGDISFNANLTTPGSYIVALTENNNKAFGDLPGGVIDPAQFDHFGLGNFTVPQFSYTPNSTGAFFAPDGSQRNGTWALDIIGVASAQTVASVPLPGGLSLFGGGLGLCSLLCRRRKHS